MKLRNALLKLIISLIASLPFGLLYLVSDFLYLIVYYIIGYRKKVTLWNLKNSFPEKNDKEIEKIEKQFYHNFCDLTLEVIKSQKMTTEQLSKRVTFKNAEALDDYYKDEKNVFALLGHCGNWEWVGNRIGLFLQHEGAAVYKPIHDKFFNDYMIEQRQKYKDTLRINYKKVFRTMVKLRDKLYTVFILADQSPSFHEIDYFVEFLGKITPFYKGMEKVARALNYAVIYLNIQRLKRGCYTVEIKIISDHAAYTMEEEITKKYAHLLEQSIKTNPDNWLWTHRRWKGV